MLIDSGASATFEEVYSAINDGIIIEWLEEKGADMSILSSEIMTDAKALVVEALKQVATARKGDEGRKLGVENLGLCLVIALVLEAKATSQPVTVSSQETRLQ
jgi:hypothetical protein